MNINQAGSLLFFSVTILFSCTTRTVKIENKEKGHLKATMKLANIAEKKFALDSNTAPIPQYIQVFTDSTGKENFTFLNTYTNSIYFYNYKTLSYINKIIYEKHGLNSIPVPLGYFIKNYDSIYVFSKLTQQLILANIDGKIFDKISLINNKNIGDTKWSYSFPQHYPYTVTPILATNKELIFPGQFMGSIPDNMINRFKFETHINLTDNKVSFARLYPPSLYSYFWGNQEIFTTVYSDLSSKEGQIVYSFPTSHDLYLANIDSEGYRTVYAGSNDAGTIISIKKDLGKHSGSIEDMILNVCKTDMYAAIKYDKYRKVYYRFLRKAIPDATKLTSWKDKPIAVIMFDENFNYLGETVLGTMKNYHWENSFVTEEGLNIQYLEKNDNKEDYLTLKIFVPQKI